MSRRLFHGQLADDIAGDDRLRAERLRLLARSLVDIVREALVRDGMVRIHGFGTFRLTRVKARRGINPQTGEPIDIPARNRVLFRPSKALRDRIEPDHPAAVPLAEPHESREAWLGGVMAYSPVAGSLPAADNQRTERSYFPDRVAAAAMAEPTVRITGSAHPPAREREGGSREANLGGTMADGPSAGRVVLGEGAVASPAAPTADASGAGGDDTAERGSREARLGTSGGVHAPTAGALPREDAGPDAQEPGRPGSLPATQQGPTITPPAAADLPVDRGKGSREAQLGGQATRVAAAGGLPEEGAPDVDSSQDWVARHETTGAAATPQDEDWDVPRLYAPGEEPEPEPEPEPEHQERGPAGPLLLLGVLLLLLLLGLVGWWLWPASEPSRPVTPVATGEIERSEGEPSGAVEPESAAGETTTAAAEPDTSTAEPETATAASSVTAEPAIAETDATDAQVEPEAAAEASAADTEAASAEATQADATETGAGEAEAADGDATRVAAAEPTEPAVAETTAGALEATAESTMASTDESATEVATAEAAATDAAQATDAAPTTTGEAPWFSGQEYVVVRGDTLWDLSDFHYVNPYYWPHIWNHNQSLADPDRIEIDQVLLLPTLEGEPRNLTAADRRSIAEGYLRLYRLWQRTDAGNPQYALVGVRYFDPEVMPPELRNDPAAGLPGDALAAAFAALLEAEFPIQRQ